MQIQDIDKVNHLIEELNGMNALITHTNDADPAECELFIKLPGDFFDQAIERRSSFDTLPRLLSLV